VRQHFTWDQVAGSTLDVYECVRANPDVAAGTSWAVTA
jgi:hypothetical protein